MFVRGVIGRCFGLLFAVSVLCLGSAAIAAPHSSTSLPELGKTLPPIGFVKFCAENPAECVATVADRNVFQPSAPQWNLIYQVNTFVNNKIEPMSDLELYGQAEYWTYPTISGDCEDYLLLKKRYLEGLGFPSSALLITVVLDEKGEGHAVLTLATVEGDFVLDNRRNEVLGWQQTNYSFLKRQSPQNPKLWVALSKKKAAGGERLASSK
jgi:predicted transglutaminase-like cysteine proteinase